MPKSYRPQVITANALISGDAVWLTETNAWTGDITQAELLTDEAHAELRLLEAMTQQNAVAGVYLAEAKATRNGPAPTHFREVFRTRGPSNYPHGKQVDLS